MFHEHRDLITQLKQKDTYFTKIFVKHNDLDEEIRQMEKSLVNEFEIEKKKKEKLKLKDQVYSYIMKYKKENKL